MAAMNTLAYPVSSNPDSQAGLIDRFGRRISYLRVSVTDRCDLRCHYCLPAKFSGFEVPSHWLSFDEIERVVAAFVRAGVGRVRLTGGEPLMRKGLPDLVGRLAALDGLDDLSLSTNGTQLRRYAAPLKAAGLQRMNLSLDSLNRACIQQITGKDSLASVLDGLQAAKQAGISPIKVNMVVMQGINAHEVRQMAEFCIEQGLILRMIEEMPMGQTGSARGQLTLDSIRQELVAHFDLRPSVSELGGGPARYWESQDGRAVIGFITPMSQHFCASCNRIRLAVDGTLYLCLGQQHQLGLREPLRQGISDDGLDNLLREAIELKPERHEFIEQPHKIVRFMAQTGG